MQTRVWTSWTNWAEAPHEVETQAVAMAKLHARVPLSEIQGEMGRLVAELLAELKRQGVSVAGPWFTHHRAPPGVFFDCEVCFPVSVPVHPVGRVQPGEWPAMRVVRAVYSGSYEGLAGAWGELRAWAQAQGLAAGEEAWERYLTGPHENADRARWQTELNLPLA